MAEEDMESDLWPLLEDLQDTIDGLSDSLKPLLKNTLPENTSRLPLVDQAKLYVLTTYAIESLLFSYLDLHGVKAKDHPVMTELVRVKQYFAKIREAETKPSTRNNALDKEAAGRFIKHALSGNDAYDRQRAEELAKQRAKAHIRFNELGEPKTQVETASLATQRTETEEKATPEGDPSLLAVYDGGDDIEGVSLMSENASGVSTPAVTDQEDPSENTKGKRKRAKTGKDNSRSTKEKKRK